jgi:hypothetical protein
MSSPLLNHGSTKPISARVVWLILGPLICAVMSLPLAARLRPNEHKLHDFVQEWTSARNWMRGQPIYDDLGRSVAAHIRPDLVSTLPIQYNAHPPVAVLLSLPFGVLPYHQAVVVWNLLSLAALVASVGLVLGRRGLGAPRWMWWPVGSLLLISSPLAHQVYMAQLNLVLLLLFTLAWRLERSGRAVWSGAVVGLAAAVKIFPGFLVLYFLAQRRWRALAASAASVLFLNALSLLVLGAAAWRDYVTVVMPAVAGFRAAWANASIPGFWAKLFDPPNPVVMPLAYAPEAARVLTAVSCLAFALTTIWAASRATCRAQRDCAFAACCVGAILLSPVVWHHYFVILTLPLLILWCRLPPTWLTRVILSMAILLLIINPAWVTGVDVPIVGPQGEVIQPATATPAKTLTSLSFQFYTLLVLWIAGVIGSRISTIPVSSERLSPSDEVTDLVPQTAIS